MTKLTSENVFKYKLNDTLAFGKYKFKTLQYAIDTNPYYIQWLKENAKDLFVMENESYNYLIEKLVINSLNNVKFNLRKKYKK